ncbi:hypothetical protein ACHAC9_20690 [Massilia sp. CMS3.1]|uniref:hypothetical protein n=1 Tax=Massilia sp. CMS3.1 TaxID=3373083 RepID=UPI003EE7D1F6
MSTFEDWMRDQGLSESSIKKYGSAVTGPLTAWANSNSVMTGSLTTVTDFSTFQAISSEVQKLPIFIERDSTGHGMYSAALIKFAKYLRLGKPSPTRDSTEVNTLPTDLIPFTGWGQTARRMVKTAQQTTNSSNGQEVLQTIKNKNNAFTSQDEFSEYVGELLERQKFCCAISGLLIHPDNASVFDDEMKASLDRIDSSGHYERGNLQVVCRFINRWKGADPNAQFLSLMDALRKYWTCEPTKKTR